MATPGLAPVCFDEADLNNKSMDVAVVGAGIIGLAHAYVAAKAGHKVSVFERNPVANGASVRNFGMVWPIGQPAGVMHEVALRSAEIWRELLNDAGLPYISSGSLHAAYQEDEATVGREFAERAKPLGYECEWLDAAKTLEKSSALRPEGLLGALWSPTEMTVDPRQVIARIPAFLSERYGVRFHFNSAVIEVGTHTVRTHDRCSEANLVIVASGDDFQTLFPDLFAAAGLTRCKLQMLRTEQQPENWRLGPSLAFGLTFRHYPVFNICESLTALKARVARELPEFGQWHIHVMASENAMRQITLGDSHEYGLAVDIFDRTRINDLILEYAREYLRVPSLRIAETWHGVYAKHPEKQFLRLTPVAGVQVVTVTSGVGMTLSFGLAEQTYRELGMLR
jgi:FAD dependent oxidoreductase TIGR03364